MSSAARNAINTDLPASARRWFLCRDRYCEVQISLGALEMDGDSDLSAWAEQANVGDVYQTIGCVDERSVTRIA
jgi:hypothetical protein